MFVLHLCTVISCVLCSMLVAATGPLLQCCLFNKLCPNGWMDRNATWHEGRPQPRRLCVRWGTQPPPSTEGMESPPQFSAHFYCGQTAGCIDMPLGTEVGLSPGDFVLDGDLPSQKRRSLGAELPNFRPMSIVAMQTAAWIKMPLGTEVCLGLRDIVFDVDPATPDKGHTHPTQFWPMSIVAKWLDG